MDNCLHGRLRTGQQGSRRVLLEPEQAAPNPGPNTRPDGQKIPRHQGHTHRRGIALALEAHTHTRMLAILSDCRPAIRTTENLNSGTHGPRSHIEARIQEALEDRSNQQLETMISWVKGHKDIKGNERADALSKQASILGHESEGTVTPAGLKAWARRVRAEARGNGNGLLGWCRKALSAYTWCRTNKGPQNEWLFRIKKTDTESCKCGAEKMTGTHVVEECPELSQWRPRRAVWKNWKEALGGRAIRKEEEEEGDALGAFFFRIYEFLFTFSNPPPVIHRPHVPERYTVKFVPAVVSAISVSPVMSPRVVVPAELPARYAIDFVPAVGSVLASTSVSAPPVSASSSDYSVVSSANFVLPSPDYSVVSSANFVIPTACIESNT